jgi:hypothetical protein
MTDDSSDSDEQPTEEAGEEPPEDAEAFGMVSRVLGVWDEVLEDMEATADEYRDEGWDVLEIHPGDVATPDGEEGGRWGIDVLVPDDEFEELEALIEADFGFDGSEVYRATAQGLVLLVVAVRDEESKQAVLFPAYYDVDRGRTMLERATAEGEMRTHLRPLDLQNVVTFTHDDPSLFTPPTEGADPGEK